MLLFQIIDASSAPDAARAMLPSQVSRMLIGMYDYFDM